MARSLDPCALAGLHTATNRSTSSADIYRGNDDSLQWANLGTAPTNSAEQYAYVARKRKNIRIALATDLARLWPVRLALVRMNFRMSVASY